MAWLLMFAAIAALATGTVAQDDEEEQQPGVNVRATWRFHRQAVQMQNWKKDMAASLNTLTVSANGLAEDFSEMVQDAEAAVEVIDQYGANINAVVDELSDKLENYNDSAVPEYEAPPAFQATINESQSSFIAIGFSPIAYANVLLNHGDHYDPSTGLFIAPVSGLYDVFVTFTNTFMSEIVIMVVTPSAQYTSVGYTKYYNDQETACTAVTMMEEGDTLGVYPLYAGMEEWSLPSGLANTFGAFMIGRS